MPTRNVHAISPRADARASDLGAATIEEGRVEFAALPLYRGGRIAPAVVHWRLAGAAGAPIVAALGGISAHRRVFDAGEPRNSWWPALVGPGQPLDTRRFRVLGIDWLVDCDNASPIDVRDQVAALLAVCDRLGIGQLHAVAGASYGGMVGLALAEVAPQRVRHVLAISAAHRSNSLSTAWRAIQREIVRHALLLGDGPGGLRIARALAMTTYRTRTEFNSRFPATALGTGGRTSFPIEEYLFSRGDEFARRHRPESFLSLSESIDLHRIDPAKVRVPVTLVAIIEDQLVPIEDIRELSAGLAGSCRLIELHSHFGHDAFLKERGLLASAFAAALDGD